MPAYSPTRGFTLIELLVVIAIIGVFSAVVLSSLNIARDRAKDAARMSNVKSLKTAMESYHIDNNQYPQLLAPDTASNVHNLMPFLAPKHIPIISSLLIYDNDQYVWGPDDSYGLYIYSDKSQSYCRTGVNVNPEWWGSPPECTF